MPEIVGNGEASVAHADNVTLAGRRGCSFPINRQNPPLARQTNFCYNCVGIFFQKFRREGLTNMITSAILKQASKQSGAITM